MSRQAVIYTRVSLDRDGTKASPETQEAECRAYCKEKGWEVIGVYCDRNASAFKKNVKRPQLEKMFEALERGRANTLVAFKLDRLTRGGVTGIFPIIERLQKVDATLAFVHDDIDTTTPMGKGVLAILASVAEQESFNTSTRTKARHARNAKAGQMHAGGNRQFGYQRDGTIIEAEADVIRETAQRIRDGASLRSVAVDLNERGLRTTTGREWSSRTLQQMLRSPRIAGLRVHRGKTYPGTWEPILPPEDHASVVSALETPLAERRTQKHLLSGLAVCTLCGGKLRRKKSTLRNRQPYELYTCERTPGAKNCGRVNISKDNLDAYVVDQLFEFLSSAEMQPGPKVDRKKELEAQLAADRKRLSTISRMTFYEGTMDESDYLDLRKDLSDRIAAAQSALAAIARQEEQEALALRPGKREDLEAWWERADDDARRGALDAAVSSIAVAPVVVRGRNRFDPARVKIHWQLGLYSRYGAIQWDQMTPEERAEAEEVAAEEAFYARLEEEHPEILN